MRTLLISIVTILILACGAAAQTTYQVSGQVMSDDLNGLPNAHVEVTSANCGGWGGASAYTSPFGYYSIGFPANCLTLTVTASKKQYHFFPDSHAITVPTPPGDIFMINFIEN